MTDPAPLLAQRGNLGVIMSEAGAPRKRLLRPPPPLPDAAVVAFPIKFM